MNRSENINMIDKRIRWNYTAYIGRAYSNVTYWGQYDNLINCIYDTFRKENKRFETIAIPLLHLIGHSIELGLKENIKHFNKYNNKSKPLNSKSINSLLRCHNASTLLYEFDHQYCKLCDNLNINNEEISTQYKMYFQKSVQLINILNTETETYRYAEKIVNEGEKSKSIVHFDKVVDFYEIKELFDEVVVFLSYVSDVISYWTDYYDYISKFPEYKKGKGYLKKPKLFVASKELEKKLIERLDEQFERRDENLWYDSEENEFMEVQIDGTDFYVIVINY